MTEPFDSGGALSPGWAEVRNDTDHDERLLTREQIRQVFRNYQQMREEDPPCQ